MLNQEKLCWEEVEWILQYSKGLIHPGLLLLKTEEEKPRQLQGYVNANFVIDPNKGGQL